MTVSGRIPRAGRLPTGRRGPGPSYSHPTERAALMPCVASSCWKRALSTSKWTRGFEARPEDCQYHSGACQRRGVMSVAHPLDHVDPIDDARLRWAEQWRKRRANGEVIVIRYADDTIVGFRRHADAERFLRDLRERLATFGLALHPG